MAFSPVLEQFIEVEPSADEQDNIDFSLSDPGADKLLVIGVSVRNTITAGDVSAPTGWSEAVAVFNAMVCKIFFKLSVGGETSVTVPLNDALIDIHSSGAWLAVWNAGTGWAWLASPLDKTATANSSGTSVTSQGTGTTATLAQADQLAIAHLGIRRTSGATGSHAANNSFTFQGMAQPTGGTIAESGMAYRVLAADTGITTTFSWTTAYRAAGAIATFMAEETAPPAGTPTTQVVFIA